MLPLPVPESKRIFVSISQQRLWAYQDGVLLWEWVVSTGLDNSPTWPGVFQIRSFEREAYAADWDLDMPFFMGIYEPTPGANVMNGFHGYPSRDGAQVLWMHNLGEPVTFGCIMLSTDNCEALFDWADLGTIVEIRP